MWCNEVICQFYAIHWLLIIRKDFKVVWEYKQKLIFFSYTANNQFKLWYVQNYKIKIGHQVCEKSTHFECIDYSNKNIIMWVECKLIARNLKLEDSSKKKKMPTEYKKGVYH